MSFFLIITFFSEQIKEVPTKLDNLLLKKHYLHGTELVVNAGRCECFWNGICIKYW